MRRFARAFWLMFIACALAACTMTDQYVQGVGPDLYWSGVSNTSALQDVYVSEICHQAGLLVSGTGVAQSCNPDALNNNEWFEFVQAGMNDIDQRCDAYLSWLDEQKRTSQSILQEITDVRTATIAIMSVTGAGVTPIAIAAAAIGLAADTFSNSNSRLLMDLDHSTVQQIVLTNQATFRTTLPTIINNRSAAFYALRLYLRTCTPFAIAAQVNTTIKLYERGGIDALKAAETGPAASAGIVETAVTPVLDNARVPLGPAIDAHPSPGARPFSPGDYEATLLKTPRAISNLQTALCVRPSGILGPKDSETRLAIRSYFEAAGKPLTQVITQRNYNWLLRAVFLVVNHGKGSCGAMGFRNAADVAHAIFPPGRR